MRKLKIEIEISLSYQMATATLQHPIYFDLELVPNPQEMAKIGFFLNQKAPSRPLPIPPTKKSQEPENSPYGIIPRGPIFEDYLSSSSSDEEKPQNSPYGFIPGEPMPEGYLYSSIGSSDDDSSNNEEDQLEELDDLEGSEDNIYGFIPGMRPKEDLRPRAQSTPISIVSQHHRKTKDRPARNSYHGEGLSTPIQRFKLRLSSKLKRLTGKRKAAAIISR